MKISAFSIEKTYDYGLDDGICDYSVSFDCRMSAEEFEMFSKYLNDGTLEILGEEE